MVKLGHYLNLGSIWLLVNLGYYLNIGIIWLT